MTRDALRIAVPLLGDFLWDTAERHPDKIALIVGSDRISYRDLAARASSLASYLVSAGVSRGDRVMVFAENSAAAAVAFWAALGANAVATVVSPLTKPDKLAYLLSDCRPRALIADAGLLPVFATKAAECPHLRTVVLIGAAKDDRVGALSNPRSWDAALAEGAGCGPVRSRCLDVDLAAIVYTSGSTGAPKGVMLTHRNMLTAANSVGTYLGLRGDDVVLSALPLAFDYGLYQLILSVRAGATLVLERTFAFPAQVMKRVAEEGATVFPGVPTMFAMLGEMKSLGALDLSRLRIVTNTAAALAQKHIDLLRRTFPNALVFSMYGLTECKRCTYLPPEDLDRKPGSVGVAIPNTELWIIDDDGNRVGPGVVGELVIRGATVMKGYWEKPEATAEKLHPGPLPGELVLHTGDYCRLDDEGYLYFVGRMDDIIKTRGEKVAPKEVENALIGISGVKEAAVIGVPDDLFGLAVKAFVVLESGAHLTEREIIKECQGLLEAYMVPRTVLFLDDIPKTNTGKITKTGLS